MKSPYVMNVYVVPLLIPSFKDDIHQWRFCIHYTESDDEDLQKTPAPPPRLRKDPGDRPRQPDPRDRPRQPDPRDRPPQPIPGELDEGPPTYAAPKLPPRKSGEKTEQKTRPPISGKKNFYSCVVKY